MTRLIAVFVALLFALGAVSVPIVDAAGTTTKPPAKSGDAQPETKGGAGKPMTKKLDINSASKDDLEQLPGIGDALYEKIKEQVIAKQETAKGPATGPTPSPAPARK